MDRSICIHGHFYQPPRENPWLEAVEVQDSAYPYHDWNERITAECYAPNAASRILDERGCIARIVNNYERISFNFGPTLLAWLERCSPEVYRTVLKADRDSAGRFSGHGSALAQPYNHMILPLANARDKYTQLLWGLRDFEHRFGRKPEGMWLPETAVDLETLEMLAGLGIRFTVLGPHQARRVRETGQGRWSPLEGKGIDPTMAYRVRLGQGKALALFFFDGPISRDVSFGGLLNSGEAFVDRLLRAFSDRERRPQIVHIATDGEIYGHHHRFGEMALAFALHAIESRGLARLTNYGEYLERHPPAYEVEIVERTSWSCPHGVGRWERDCGCATGSRPGWNQTWRAPLRRAMDELRDALAVLFEEQGAKLFKDPWAARDAYIELLLDRSPERFEEFVGRHGLGRARGPERRAALRLLEIQRHAMLMYTSCGWFFADPSGIETVQILQYAGRALSLADTYFGTRLEGRFLRLLREAKSNDPAQGDAAVLYERHVRSARMDVQALAAHYAVHRLREEDGKTASFYTLNVKERDFQLFKAGKARLAIGKGRFRSKITYGSALLVFAALHLGDHNVNCGVASFAGKEDYRKLGAVLSGSFLKGDFPGTIRLMDRYLGKNAYSLKSLIRDEQRRFLKPILRSISLGAENVFHQIYEESAPLMRFLKDSRIPPPPILYTAAQTIFNADLKRLFQEGRFDLKTVTGTLDEARDEGIALDLTTLEYTLRRTMEAIAVELRMQPAELSLLDPLKNAVDLLASLPFQVNVWKIQNIVYDLLQTVYPGMVEEARSGKDGAAHWVRSFRSMAEKLSFRPVP